MEISENDRILEHLSTPHDAEQQKVFEQWLDESPERKETHRILKQAWDNSASILPNHHFDTEAAWHKISQNISIEENRNVVRPLYQRLKWMAAASIVLTIGLIFYFNQQIPTNNIIAHSGTQIVTLPDGSIVKLEKGSQIKFGEVWENGARKVELMGRANFEVVKNPEQPFIVHTAQADVQVLGTVFDVKSSSLETRVMVLEGKVRVEKLHSKENNTVILTPNKT